MINNVIYNILCCVGPGTVEAAVWLRIDLNQQKSLLSLELSNCDLIIEQLQAEKQALDDKYQHSCVQVGRAMVHQ